MWAKMKGYPPWPARVVTSEEFEVSSGQKLRSRTQICFSFFGTYDYGQTTAVDQVGPPPSLPPSLTHSLIR